MITPKLNSKFAVSLIILLCIGLAGCLVSEVKLFPYGEWRLATSVKSGYYIVREMYIKPAGRNFASSGDTLTSIHANQGKYKMIDGEVSTDESGKYIEFFTAQTNGTYIAQYAFDGIFSYEHLYVKESNSFYTERKDCNGLKQAYLSALVSAGAIKLNRNVCMFSDRQNLVDTLSADDSVWERYSIYYYEYILPQPVAPAQLKQPMLFPYENGCDAKVPKPPITYSDAYQNNKTSQGAHLNIIANTQYATLSLEMMGNKIQHYARLTDPEIKCAPNYVIKIAAFKPVKSVFSQTEIEPDLDKVNTWCSLERENGLCGTIDEAIKHFQQQGFSILLQGIQMLLFHDGKLAEGDLITVMGLEGKTNKLVVLKTNIKHTQGKGITKVSNDYSAESILDHQS